MMRTDAIDEQSESTSLFSLESIIVNLKARLSPLRRSSARSNIL